MRITPKAKNIIALILNFADMLLMIYCIPIFHGTTSLDTLKAGMGEGLKYFTLDSNMLMALACNIMVVYNIRALKGKSIPKWITVFKFAATSGVALTFVTVMLFLGPMNGFDAMFRNSNLYMHLICPIICIVCFVFFEPGCTLTFKDTFFGITPMVIYGTVYGIMVFILGKWKDIYNFNVFGMWYLFFVIMFAGGFAISFALRFFRESVKNKPRLY